MTEQNKTLNIRDELERANDCLKSADLLAANGQLADAVSRLYYYAYHSMRALLLSKSLEPKTHEGTLRLLGLHFIKPKIFSTNISHIFARLMKYMEEADYNALYIVAEEDYPEFRSEAVLLYNKITEFLKNEDLI